LIDDGLLFRTVLDGDDSDGGCGMMYWRGRVGQRADCSNNLITADQSPSAGNRSARTQAVVWPAT